MCHRHPTVPATVKIPRGEFAARHLCGDCLRDERPVVFVSIHLPPSPHGIR